MYVLHLDRKTKKLGNSLDDADLHTVEDLAKSILAYGNVSKIIYITTLHFNIPAFSNVDGFQVQYRMQ